MMAQCRWRREGLLSPCCSSFLPFPLHRVSIFTHLQQPHFGAARQRGGWGLGELQVTTLFALLYSSSSSSSGDLAVPLRLLTRGAERPGEVGSHLGGKWQKSASSWGRRDPSPGGSGQGQEGRSQGGRSCPQPQGATSRGQPWWDSCRLLPLAANLLRGSQGPACASLN